MSLQTPEAIRTLQRKLYGKAKAEPGFRFYLLYDKVWRADILRHAYDLARANQGAPGVDGVTFERIEAAGLADWLTRLGEDLRAKAYRCQAVRRMMIPKPGGGERPLGIPTIRDRVVQTAAKLVLEPIFEADLEPAAYGYRPGRSASEAIQAVLVLLRQGHTDVVDADLSKYFDTIPHDELMLSIARRIVDPDMLRLIKQWLKTPVETTDPDGKRRMEGGKASRQGVPQGGVISPLVANLYMNRFLKHWRQTGRSEAWQAHVINYADDFVILSRGHAAGALAWTDRVMARLGLTLNRTKTRLCDARAERFDFLGYSFGPHCFRQTGRWFIGASPSAKSVQRLKDKVGAILVPGNMGRWEEVRDTLNRLLRGWCGYFSPGSHYVTDRAIEAHVYDRVRNFLVRRHKMPPRSIGPFRMEAVFGELGVLRAPHCRRSGARS
ncbi:MAG: group II intron reverse transcriptase/maturase [Acetobacteraceae bacterium]|nr:group II intron reverse transcriptase/maturase [Acetobacteraceae bacterium]